MQNNSLVSQGSWLMRQSKAVLAVVTTLLLLMAVLVPTHSAQAASSSTAIDRISPSVGATTGGTPVTITGSGFTAAGAGTTTVLFGGTFATNVVVVSNTSITAVAPAGSAGAVSVKVTNALSSVTVNNAFTYKATTIPTVSAVSPNSGFAGGFNRITIYGTNFASVTAVRFGTVLSPSFTINSDTQISAVVPAGVSSTSVDVRVSTTTATSANLVTYKYLSTICTPKTYRTTTFKYRSATLTAAQKSAIRASANELIALGCDQVNLVKYKGSTKGASAAYKAYIALSNKRADAVNSIFVKQLAYKGKTMKVNVIKRATQVSQSKKALQDLNTTYRKVLLTVTRTDAIAGIYPAAGASSGGQPVTITGTGFGAVAPTGAIKFGGVISPSYVINVTGDTIVATVPAGTIGTATVSIQYGVDGSTGAKLVLGQYSYVSNPTITGVTPTSGSIAGGNSVTIIGTGFTGVTGANAVKFGDVNATSYTVTPTSITAIAPANSVGSKNITITGVTGSSNPISYDYQSAPSITAVSPANGPRAGLNTVTITGTGLSGATASTILFGTATGTDVVVNASGTSLTVKAPRRDTDGKVNLTITTPRGSTVLNDGYTYGFAITSLSQTTGPTGGGQKVVITGVDFPETIYAVTFGAPTGVTILGSNEIATIGAHSATTITVTAPDHVAGTVPVRVYSSSNVNSYTELAAAFTYVAPTITSVSASSGPIAGGTTITIVGTGFGSIESTITRTVSVGGATCTAPTVTVDNTTMTCVTPARDAGARDVVVTINGNSATKTGGFTYLEAPTISSLSPTTGTTAGGTTVTITGTNFVEGATTIRIDGVTRPVTWTSAISIRFTTPAHAAGPVNVTVTTAGGQTDPTTFTYLAP